MSFGLALGFPRSGAYLLEWAIRALFAGGQQGAWYDPSDYGPNGTLFTDSAGTVPVTAVEQPVGLMLDKRLGLVLGPEFIVNWDFSNGTTGWDLGVGWSISGGSAQIDGSGGANSYLKATTSRLFVAGSFYRVSYSYSVSAGRIRINSGALGTTQIFSSGSSGVYTAYLPASLGGLQTFWIQAIDAGTIATIDNISVRELPGNHAYHTPGSTLARPVLRALYNMLAGTATLSTQSVTTAATTNKLRFEGTGTITLSGTATGTYSAGTHSIVCTAGTLTLTVSGTVTRADLRAANEPAGLPEYQAVSADRLTYDTVGFPVYLRTDGVDDGMQTNSIDFSASDKMFVAAGVRKLSDATQGIVLELSANAESNNGAFYVAAPATNALTNYQFASRGTTTVGSTKTGIPAPTTDVLSGLADISGDSAILRVNGAQAASSTEDQGTGNFGNYPIYLFARGGSSLRANLRFYGGIIRGGTLPSAAEISNAERYLSGKATEPYAPEENDVWSFSWDSASSSPAGVAGGSPNQVTPIHTAMRRCVVQDDGTVAYYLSATGSTKKADGTAAVLNGTDGQVMVEIPKFYLGYAVSGTVTTWSISAVPRDGFAVHPAFIKDGGEVSHRYIGAYDACYLDATDGLYKSGLNLEDLTSSLDLVNDKLGSVSGVYPIAGVTREEARALAANRGSGWRQMDFYLLQAIQLLYLVEYQSFFSQNILGAGNTNGSYLASSANQSDSPHTIAGASNSLGNASTNVTTGAAVSAKPGTSFMSYRGIENFYGNAWNFVDGCNINVGATGTVYVSNTAPFSDNTSTGMTLIYSALPTVSNYIRGISAISSAFLPNNTTGAASNTYLTDYFYASAPANRVLCFGGDASDAALAGAFCLFANVSSGNSSRRISARLAR